MKYITIAILLTLIAVLLSEGANAQACSTPTEIGEIIEEYGEVPVFTAADYDSDGKPRVVMGFVNYSTGSFSVVLRLNRGSYCLIASGYEWQDL